MDRSSDREMRIVVLEERLSDMLERQEAILDEVERMSEDQDLIVSAIL